jgi:hypothetical protein
MAEEFLFSEPAALTSTVIHVENPSLTWVHDAADTLCCIPPRGMHRKQMRA